MNGRPAPTSGPGTPLTKKGGRSRPLDLFAYNTNSARQSGLLRQRLLGVVQHGLGIENVRLTFRGLHIDGRSDVHVDIIGRLRGLDLGAFRRALKARGCGLHLARLLGIGRVLLRNDRVFCATWA